MRHLFRIFFFAVGFSLSAASASAQQYYVIDLNSSAFQGTYGLAASGNFQVGKATSSGQSKAVMWTNLTASTIFTLHPSTGFASSVAQGTDGNFVAGYGVTTTGSQTEALLWQGETTAPFNMNPTVSSKVATKSVMCGVYNTQEVGYGDFATLGEVALTWAGTSTNAVNLNPTGATGSQALATNGSFQAGYATFSGVAHAVYWNGTAASVVDLSGGTSSHAVAISTSTVATVGDKGGHAYWWQGSATSGGDLNPSGFTSSQALGISNTQVAGYAVNSSGKSVAYLWDISGAPAVNLSTFLPTGTTSSEATGIDSNGNIIGYALESDGLEHAVIWQIVVPPSISSTPQAATAAIGVQYTFYFAYSASPSPTISVSSGSLPPGLSLVAGGISGTPTQLGTYSCVIEVDNNGNSPPATQNFSLTIVSEPSLQVSALTSFVAANGYSISLARDPTSNNVYCAAYFGGSASKGTLLKIASDGTQTVLHNFADGSVTNDGKNANSLIVYSDGSIYGTTSNGGASPGVGTIFKYSNGTVSILHTFQDGTVSQDGTNPSGAPVLGSDGNFYGVTAQGGSGSGGVIYRITPQGAYTILHNFNDGTVTGDGKLPTGSPALGSDGNIYGTTAGPLGIIYKITPQGVYSIAHHFSDPTVPNDGLDASGILSLGKDGSLYGTNRGGGTANLGTLYRLDAQGNYSILHSFGDGTVAGEASIVTFTPNIVVGPDGNLYIGSYTGGFANAGAIFQINAQGKMLLVYNFYSSENPNVGTEPDSNLVVANDGSIYGVNIAGFIQGVLFKVTIATTNTAPSFTSAAPTSTATVGVPYNFPCTANGSPAPTFSVPANTLPPGLAISSTGMITGTPTTPGVYTGTITASNSSGSPATQNFTITVSTSFSTWATAEGLSGANAAPTAILSPDGLTNLVKYSLGLNPNTTSNPGSAGLPVVQMQDFSNVPYLTLTFTGVATDVTYTVEASSELTGTWANVATFSGQSALGTFTVQDVQNALPATSTKRFMRLQVSQ